MNFLHAPLIAIGSLFISIPILLHLLMRRKPKPMVFPALRFVRQRQRVSQRRMKLRHLLLLMLRCVALAVLAAGLARPFVPSTSAGNWLLILGLGVATIIVSILAYVAWTEEGKRALATALTLLAALLIGLLGISFAFVRANPSAILVGDEEPPVAAALLIDRAPRMAYLHKNETRLEKAKKLASWLLEELPPESDIAVLDSSSSLGSFAVDRDTAAKAIEAMEVEYRSVSLPALIERATEALAESAHQRKEIYVLTDLTERSWSEDASALAERLAAIQADHSTYLIDVGIEDPGNLIIHPPTLSAVHISPGSAVELVTAISGVGVSGEVDLELVIELPDRTLPMIVNGEPVLPDVETRGRAAKTLQEDGSAEVSFTLRGLAPGLHHGQIRTPRQDGLLSDNRRYFTLQVGDPKRVLLIAEREIYSEFISGALSPTGDDEAGDSLFSCETVTPRDVPLDRLHDFAAVALVDPSPLPETLWSALSTYATDGGSVAILLGREATPVSEFNTVGALSVMPGRLVRQFRSAGRNNMLATPAEAHPMLRVLRARASAIAWNAYPVFRHWELGDVRQSATTVMSFTNGMPAIIESQLGAGRVVAVTTPFTDPLNITGREPWNLIPTGPEPWPYVVLVNEMFRYLVNDGEASLNYNIGDVATIDVPTDEGASFQLFSPAGTWQPVTPAGKQLTVSLTDAPGAYRVRSTVNPEQQSGFSVNMPVEETQLTRVSREVLDRLLGDGYRIAKDEEEIVRDMSEVRRGREFYPWLMLFLATVLGLESLLSNRFYADRARLHEERNP